MITVAVVSPLRSLEPIQKVITEHDFGCTFRAFVYNQLSDIDGIYEVCKNQCDVIFFSGELGYHYIKERFPDIKIPCAFTAYQTADVLSQLLIFHTRHPEVPLNRLFIDFLTPRNNFMNLQDYLPADQMPYVFEGQTYSYKTITQQTEALWNAGKIDYVLSRSINNLKELDIRGIPYEALFPTERMIQSSIEDALNHERLTRMNEYLWYTAVIRIPASSVSSSEEREYILATVYKFLVDYRKEQETHFRIHDSYDGFMIRTQLTGPKEPAEVSALFLKALRDAVPFVLSVGFGAHINEEKSRLHAEKARLESSRSGKNEAYLVSGEPEVLTGPLGREHSVRYSYEESGILQTARNLGIGDSVMLRLAGLYRSDPELLFTASDLAPLLGVTTRSVHRVLDRLLNADIIFTAEDAPSFGRGRPQHRFRFNAEVSARIFRLSTLPRISIDADRGPGQVKRSPGTSS